MLFPLFHCLTLGEGRFRKGTIGNKPDDVGEWAKEYYRDGFLGHHVGGGILRNQKLAGTEQGRDAGSTLLIFQSRNFVTEMILCF